MTFSMINTILIGLLAIGLLYFIHQLVDKVRSIGLKDKSVVKVSVKDDAIYNVQINRAIYKLRHDINAIKVCVARFHNGGAFANGFDMKKFSVTHETPYPNHEPLMNACQSVLNSRYPDAFLQLVSLGEYMVYDIEDCTDPNFKTDMKKYGFKSAYLFLIRQFDGSDEGFIGVNFSETHVLSAEHKTMIKELIPTILGLVNMTASKNT